jgi:hypothetical protein
MRLSPPSKLLAACAVLVLAACSLNRDDPSKIEDLRILAIQATPPEFFYPVHGNPLAYQCQPDLSGVQTSGQVDLEALVVDPTGNGRDLTWTWTFCPSDANSSEPTDRCPTDPAYFIAKGTTQGPAGIAATWSLAQTALQELATQQNCHPPQVCPPTPLLTALGQNALDLCRFGIWLQIGLEVDAQDGEQIFGSKLLVFTPVPDDYPKDPAICPQGPDGGPPPHDNPPPVGLSLGGLPLIPFEGSTADGGTSDGGTSDGGMSDGGTSDGGMSDGGTIDGGVGDAGTNDGGTSDGGSSDGGAGDGGMNDGGMNGGVNEVFSFGQYDVRPLPPDGGAQDYCVATYGGGWTRLTESWLFSLMTTGGSFSSQQVGGKGGAGGTGFGAPPGPTKDLTVQWTTPNEAGISTFYEVTRDGRGGTSWTIWQVQIVVP